MDLVAAAEALKRRKDSDNTPREYSGPVPDVSQRAPKPSHTGFPPVVRQTILDRDHMACVRCGVAIDTGHVGYSLQHRDNRGSGGTSDPRVNWASNGATMCGSGTTGCHGWAEDHETEAAELGYVVKSWADPATVPMLTPAGWVLLDRNGNKHPCPPPPNGDAHQAAQRKESYR